MAIFRGNETGWNLYDLHGTKWRRMVFEMTHDQRSDIDMTSNEIEQPFNGFAERPISLLSKRINCTMGRERGNQGIPVVLPMFSYIGHQGFFRFKPSSESRGKISTRYELEQYYSNLLGWTNYYKMSKEGNKVRVCHPDRRLMSHLVALLSSLSLYLWYKYSTNKILGLSVDLQALIIAYYALHNSLSR